MSTLDTKLTKISIDHYTYRWLIFLLRPATRTIGHTAVRKITTLLGNLNWIGWKGEWRSHCCRWSMLIMIKNEPLSVWFHRFVVCSCNTALPLWPSSTLGILPSNEMANCKTCILRRTILQICLSPFAASPFPGALGNSNNERVGKYWPCYVNIRYYSLWTHLSIVFWSKQLAWLVCTCIWVNYRCIRIGMLTVAILPLGVIKALPVTSSADLLTEDQMWVSLGQYPQWSILNTIDIDVPSISSRTCPAAAAHVITWAGMSMSHVCIHHVLIASKNSLVWSVVLAVVKVRLHTSQNGRAINIDPVKKRPHLIFSISPPYLLSLLLLWWYPGPSYPLKPALPPSTTYWLEPGTPWFGLLCQQWSKLDYIIQKRPRGQYRPW